MTPLMWAAWVGDVEHVKALLAQGADPNAQSLGNPPALYWAMETYCTQEMVRTLLTAGADVNALGQGKHTILLRAVTNTEIDIIRILVQAGADVKVQEDEGGAPRAASYDGMTPLMMAALRDDGGAILALLLEAGADIDVQDRAGRTALMRARERGSRESITLLMEAGARS